MTLAIASDHGGFALKAVILQALKSWGVACEDLGTNSETSCDYPDFAHRVAVGVEDGTYERGILICGTGIGMSIAANRHPGVRAAVVSDTFSARLSREHNHSNVLCLGQRVVGPGLALDIVKAWLDAEPDQDPRHLGRLRKINPSHEVT